MKVAEIVVKILENEGITAAFGIPGAGINPVYKHLGTPTKIRHFTVRHEEAAVHAADGFFRVSGKTAMAICTSGPGALERAVKSGKPSVIDIICEEQTDCSMGPSVAAVREFE